jgi:heme-degrading monooxygenase HmoA
VSEKNSAFIVVWEFWVRSGAEAKFERSYGSEGAWVRLFSSDPAYRGTKLLRDVGEARRYLTIDSWKTHAAYKEFRGQHSQEYLAIDRVCEGLTERETKIGGFEVPSL